MYWNTKRSPLLFDSAGFLFQCRNKVLNDVVKYAKQFERVMILYFTKKIRRQKFCCILLITNTLAITAIVLPISFQSIQSFIHSHYVAKTSHLKDAFISNQSISSQQTVFIMFLSIYFIFSSLKHVMKLMICKLMICMIEVCQIVRVALQARVIDV